MLVGLLLLVVSCDAFAVSHSRPALGLAHARGHTMLAPARINLLRMAEEEEEDAAAPPEEEKEPELVNDSQGRVVSRDDIEGSSFTVQAPMKVIPGFEGFEGFDFSGEQSIPTPARGEGGLNDQGFEPYDKDKAEETMDSTYMIGLGAAAIASIALSAFNMNAAGGSV